MTLKLSYGKVKAWSKVRKNLHNEISIICTGLPWRIEFNPGEFVRDLQNKSTSDNFLVDISLSELKTDHNLGYIAGYSVRHLVEPRYV